VQHKLYQDEFHLDFLAQLDPALKPIVDWLPDYVRDYGDHILGKETQYWAYNARTGVDARGSDQTRNWQMQFTKQAELHLAAEEKRQREAMHSDAKL
jgi:hypothetical protein